jgi:hypothetical protein
MGSNIFRTYDKPRTPDRPCSDCGGTPDPSGLHHVPGCSRDYVANLRTEPAPVEPPVPVEAAVPAPRRAPRSAYRGRANR